MEEWIEQAVDSFGYVGIAFLMFLENFFPPIPSELIMPLAGFAVFEGKLNFVLTFIAGLVGTILGVLMWYYVGRFFGLERLKDWADKYGKWIEIEGKEIDRANRWFDRYGNKAVIIGRVVPAVRTVISLPAGISKMSVRKFLLYSTLGSGAWVAFLTAGGYFLGKKYEAIGRFTGPISIVVVAIAIISFVIWILKKKGVF